MIAHLQGALSYYQDGIAVIDVQGVGYEVYVPTNSRLPEPGSDSDTVKLYTHHHIREDQHLLFGFLTPSERLVFQKMISVSGVGPKVALKMLGTLSFESLIHAVLSGDLATIITVPGVGKKLAEKLILELKDKFATLPGAAALAQNPRFNSAKSSLSSALEADLMSAMKTLGYTKDEVKRAITKASASLSDAHSLEDSIKQLLKYL